MSVGCRFDDDDCDGDCNQTGDRCVNRDRDDDDMMRMLAALFSGDNADDDDDRK
jgi:hypothetical protein